MKNSFKNLLSAAVSVFFIALLFSCGNKKTDAGKESTYDPLLANLDSTLDPGEDFFRYACGSWLKKNPIPATEKGWGIWSLVQEETYQRMKTISEESAAAKSASGSLEQKIGDFYASGMDTLMVDKLGYTPLKEKLDRIDAINDLKSFSGVLSELQSCGVGAAFGTYIYQDEKNSERYAVHLYQGGLGLPDRDYYFNTDERTVNIRKEYKSHLRTIFSLMAVDSVRSLEKAEIVFKIETALAKSSRKLEDLRDPYLNYNKMDVSQLNGLLPSLDWQILLSGMQLQNVDSIIVAQPEFFKALDKSLSAFSIEQWKDYLRWQLVHSYAAYLSRDFEQENFRFFGTVMGGVKVQRPRWKRILDQEEEALGDLMGQLYVKKYVSPEFKQRYQTLTNNILEAYREHIRELTWMSDSTKAKAINKLNAITVKVAYPDRWKDYSNLSIDRKSYAGNLMRSNEWEHRRMVDKLNKPVDRTEWDMTPQTYNAYYNPSNNEIVLPAAIFIIPGLADEDADDAIIYGYAGASTIGHELTHGFDDQGRQFDEKGNLRNWWTASDEKEFNSRAKSIVNQFNGYKVLDSLHVNGEATQGENIADLGGVVLGYTAFKKTKQYTSGQKINGMTPDQRYFLGYALSWLGHMRDETLAMRIMTDVHSPNFLRVNGPLSNLPEFYKAFGITEGKAMWRADSLRVHIW